MAFGIRNVPDRFKALREFRRIMAVDEQAALASPPTAGESCVSSNEGDGGDESESSCSAELTGKEAGVSGGSSVVAILELQNPESGILAFASRAFIR